jgi:hypothetical protein
MRAATRFFCLVGLMTPAIGAGCAAVPVLTFATADASLDSDADAALDSDTDTVTLGDGGGPGPADAQAEAAMPIDGECPDYIPPGASRCCGLVACTGDCTAAECTSCEMQCGFATLCCAKANNVACRSFGSPCP